VVLERLVHRRNIGPGPPLPNGLPSSVETASTSLVDDDSHISSADIASSRDTGRTSIGMPASRANSCVASKVMPGRIWLSFGRRDDRPPRTISTFDAEASVRWPSRNITHSTAPTSAARWRIRTLPAATSS
jgi:hypothetical protein